MARDQLKALLAILAALGLVVAFAVANSGCTAGACARHSDCPHGEYCGTQGVCEVGTPGGSDTSSTDAGMVDADTTDAGTTDASPDGGS